ncbi:Uncharacterised protein [Vibrio cholerae]|nr:Uncharacterised protein [Vibrio cholerae]
MLFFRRLFTLTTNLLSLLTNELRINDNRLNHLSCRFRIRHGEIGSPEQYRDQSTVHRQRNSYRFSIITFSGLILFHAQY